MNAGLMHNPTRNGWHKTDDIRSDPSFAENCYTLPGKPLSNILCLVSSPPVIFIILLIPAQCAVLLLTGALCVTDMAVDPLLSPARLDSPATLRLPWVEWLLVERLAEIFPPFPFNS